MHLDPVKTFTFLMAALFLSNTGFTAPAIVTDPGNQQDVPPPTAYAVVKSDGNSRVWQRFTYEKTPAGQIVAKSHQYTELATGLNYQNNGQWVASKEEIDILPQGGAAATQGQHQVYFPGDIYNGEIELVTPDGQQLHSRPRGIS